MQLLSPEFFFLLAVTFAAYWTTGSARAQNALLLAASYTCYGYIHPWFMLLLAGVTCVAFAGGHFIQHSARWRIITLKASVTALLLILGIFKYADFFIANVDNALRGLGIDASGRALNLLVPLGVSFYILEAISYLGDCYRERIKAETNLLDFALFIAYFPKLFSGPIERYNHLMPQVKRLRSFNAPQWTSGLTLALWGIVQKRVVADNLLVIVNKIFSLQAAGPALLLVGIFTFSIQLLADFAGYTDMARGISRMLGIELFRNFRHPYLARSPSDFWRRWHMSLSSWIRDYVYIPLGGNRGSSLRRVLTLMMTFFCVGLWHGAAWHYVIWGLYHGVLLNLHRLWHRIGLRAPKWIAIAATYVLVALGLGIFLEASLPWLWYNLTAQAKGSSIVPFNLGLLAGFYSLAYASCAYLPVALRRIAPKRGPARALMLGITAGILLVLLIGLQSRITSDFIYYQF